MNENQPRRHLITPIVVFGITALIAVVMLLWALVIWLAQLTGSMIWATLILGGVFALSAALIENGDKQREYSGDLGDTPVFIACSDIDPHIPLPRVKRSAEIMRGMKANVTEQIYPGMGHLVSGDEIAFVRGVVLGATKGPPT